MDVHPNLLHVHPTFDARTPALHSPNTVTNSTARSMQLLTVVVQEVERDWRTRIKAIQSQLEEASARQGGSAS